MGRVLRFLLPAAALAVLLAVAAPAQQQGAPAPADDPASPLVYVFSLDGLDGDRVDQGRAPFLGRLLLGQEGNRATYYRESRGIMVAETNPNHVAMASGAYGDRSGIPGNAFAVYDQASRRDCAQQEEGGSNTPLPIEEPPNPNAPATTDGERAECLLAESFFASTRRQPRSEQVVTAGIFGKPKLAKIFATQRVTPGRYDADYLWTPCETQTDEDAPFCRNVPVNPATDYALDDSVVMDEVIRTVNEGVDADGARRRPNLTFVNFPQIDSVGHGTGARSEYDTSIAQADAQLQRFVANQRRLGLWNRTVIVVVSDHSMDTTLAKTSLRARFQQEGISSDDFVVSQNGSVDMVYLTDRTSPNRFELLRRLRAAALESEGVNEALYREPNPADGGDQNTLDVRHPGWRIAGDRTGDLFVTHDAAGAFSDPVNPLVGNHGSQVTQDNTLAVIGPPGFVRQQAIGGERAADFDDTLRNPGSAESVDVAPTVTALFGRAAPANNEGRVLTEAFEAGVLERLAQRAAGAGTGGGGGGSGGGAGATSCVRPRGFASVSVRPRGRGLRFSFARRTPRGVDVDVFLQGTGRTVLGNRLVARFRNRRASFTWRGRGNRARVRSGVYHVRFGVVGADGRRDVRRFTLSRSRGRFRLRRTFQRAPSCGLVRDFKLERAVFGGRSNRDLSISFRVGREARVAVDVLRRGRVVRRFREQTRRAGILHRLRLASERIGRGDVVIRLRARAGNERVTTTLTARRL